MIFRRGTLNTPENNKKYEIDENRVPRTERHWPSHGPKASVNPKMMQPSAHIREKWPKTWKIERVKDLVPVGQDF